ncbi:MAG: helix-turn-helix domain-containing protein, partial [Gemmatimonadota bacterium]
MSKRERLKALLTLGWPERRIARELRIHRNTVRRYAEHWRSKCTKTPTDSGVLAAVPESNSPPPATRRPFSAAAFHDEIQLAIEAGDSAQVIYQYLVDTHGYASSYDSVKR